MSYDPLFFDVGLRDLLKDDEEEEIYSESSAPAVLSSAPEDEAFAFSASNVAALSSSAPALDDFYVEKSNKTTETFALEDFVDDYPEQQSTFSFKKSKSKVSSSASRSKKAPSSIPISSPAPPPRASAAPYVSPPPPKYTSSPPPQSVYTSSASSVSASASSVSASAQAVSDSAQAVSAAPQRQSSLKTAAPPTKAAAAPQRKINVAADKMVSAKQSSLALENSLQLSSAPGAGLLEKASEQKSTEVKRSKSSFFGNLLNVFRSKEKVSSESAAPSPPVIGSTTGYVSAAAPTRIEFSDTGAPSRLSLDDFTPNKEEPKKESEPTSSRLPSRQARPLSIVQSSYASYASDASSGTEEFSESYDSDDKQEKKINVLDRLKQQDPADSDSEEEKDDDDFEEEKDDFDEDLDDEEEEEEKSKSGAVKAASPRKFTDKFRRQKASTTSGPTKKKKMIRSSSSDLKQEKEKKKEKVKDTKNKKEKKEQPAPKTKTYLATNAFSDSFSSQEPAVEPADDIDFSDFQPGMQVASQVAATPYREKSWASSRGGAASGGSRGGAASGGSRGGRNLAQVGSARQKPMLQSGPPPQSPMNTLTSSLQDIRLASSSPKIGVVSPLRDSLPSISTITNPNLPTQPAVPNLMPVPMAAPISPPGSVSTFATPSPPPPPASDDGAPPPPPPGAGAPPLMSFGAPPPMSFGAAPPPQMQLQAQAVPPSSDLFSSQYSYSSDLPPLVTPSFASSIKKPTKAITPLVGKYAPEEEGYGSYSGDIEEDLVDNYSAEPAEPISPRGSTTAPKPEDLYTAYGEEPKTSFSSEVYGPDTGASGAKTAFSENYDSSSDSDEDPKAELKKKKALEEQEQRAKILGGQVQMQKEMGLNWNDTFQSTITQLQSSHNHRQFTLQPEAQANQVGEQIKQMKAHMDLYRLVQDFAYTSEIYGKIIVSEVNFPVERKTIKPVQLGGFAGGEKFIVHGIVFKFAVDQTGKMNSDEVAMKIANHELKSLDQLFNTKIDSLCFPLMSLIDFRGYRLTALSLLPINKSTLAMGSADAGRTIMHSSQSLLKEVANACQRLNLRPHRAGYLNSNPQTVYGPVDLEGHIGTDGRMYLVDFSRLFPPAPPSPQGPIFQHLYHLLRPELVQRYPKPLCSDAFSRFVSDFPEAQEYKDHVRDAFNKLLTKVIPAFGKLLLNQQKQQLLQQRSMAASSSSSSPLSLSSSMNGEENDEFKSIDVGLLIQSVHRNGINIRLLGTLRKECRENDALADMILIEMIARTIKWKARALMRDASKSNALPGKMSHMSTVTELYNLVFGSTQSADYWKNVLLPEVSAKFSGALFEGETPDSVYNKFFEDIRLLSSPNNSNVDDRNEEDYFEGFFDFDQGSDHSLPTTVAATREQSQEELENKKKATRSMKMKLHLFHRISDMAGILFSKDSLDSFVSMKGFQSDNPFESSMIEELRPKFKHMSVLEQSRGMLLKQIADILDSSQSKERKRLYNLSIQNLKRSLESNTTNPDTLQVCCEIYLKLNDLPRSSLFLNLSKEATAPRASKTPSALLPSSTRNHTNYLESQLLLLRCFQLFSKFQWRGLSYNQLAHQIQTKIIKENDMQDAQKEIKAFETLFNDSLKKARDAICSIEGWEDDALYVATCAYIDSSVLPLVAITAENVAEIKERFSKAHKLNSSQNFLVPLLHAKFLQRFQGRLTESPSSSSSSSSSGLGDSNEKELISLSNNIRSSIYETSRLHLTTFSSSSSNSEPLKLVSAALNQSASSSSSPNDAQAKTSEKTCAEDDASEYYGSNSALYYG